jgi:hypothetical protein
MFDGIIIGLTKIIDLLSKGREAKKRELEIKKLQEELDKKKDNEPTIKPATLEDVKKYDPRIQKIDENIAKDITHFEPSLAQEQPNFIAFLIALAIFILAAGLLCILILFIVKFLIFLAHYVMHLFN